MQKIDFKKEFGKLYFPTAKAVTTVEIPPMNFLMVDGVGNPNTAPAYREALEALYGVSYTTKFALKFAGVADHKVGPLEGLWWVDDVERFTETSRDDWSWTSMIMQPGVVSKRRVDAAKATLKEEKGSSRPCEGPVRALRRGGRGADPASRAVLRGGSDHRARARLHPGSGIHTGGQAPRDLPERPAQDRTGEAPHRHPPAILQAKPNARLAALSGMGGNLSRRRHPADGRRRSPWSSKALSSWSLERWPH